MSSPSNITLRCILPSHYNRYSKDVGRDHSQKPRNTLITRNTRISKQLLQAKYVPLGWKEYIHPEGDRYFHFPEKRIVTPNSITDRASLHILLVAAELILKGLGAELVGDSIEIFLYIPTDVRGEVYYYLIDYDAGQIFWAHDIKTEDLGLEPFESDACLRSGLTSEYWMHVEYFPNHQNHFWSGEEELFGVLSHGCIDDITSPGSTCPWSSKECMEYLNVLEKLSTARGEESTPYRVVCVARLLQMIARVRHINSYGLQYPRLDRLQGLAEYSQSQALADFKIKIGEAFCLYMSVNTFKKLTALWNGRVVYQRHWMSFFDDIYGEWKRMGLLSAMIWIADIVLFAMSKSNAFTTVSASLAGAGVLVPLLLYQWHSKDRLATAPDISNFIVRVEDYQHGLRPLSIAFTLPSALTVYAAATLQVSLLSMSMNKNTSLVEGIIAAAFWLLPSAIALFFFASYGGNRM